MLLRRISVPFTLRVLCSCKVHKGLVVVVALRVYSPLKIKLVQCNCVCVAGGPFVSFAPQEKFFWLNYKIVVEGLFDFNKLIL